MTETLQLEWTRSIKLVDVMGPDKVLYRWCLKGKYASENGSFNPNSLDMLHQVGLELTSSITATNLTKSSSIGAAPLFQCEIRIRKDHCIRIKSVILVSHGS